MAEQEKLIIYDQTSESVECFFEKVNESAKMPTYPTEGTGACDFYACFGHSGILLWPGKKYPVPLGIKVKIPPGYRLRWVDRDGASAKSGIVYRDGYFDCNSHDELSVILENCGTLPRSIKDGDCVIQGELVKVSRAGWEDSEKHVKANESDNTDR